MNVIMRRYRHFQLVPRKCFGLSSCPLVRVKFGPDLTFTPTTKLEKIDQEAEKRDSKNAVEKISIEQFLSGIKELEKKHLAYIEQYEKNS